MSTSAKITRLATITENDPRLASVVARDPQPPRKFHYSVTTTGVYCRPSCATRLSKPEKSGHNFNSPSYDDPDSLASDLHDQVPRANLIGGASFEQLAANALAVAISCHRVVRNEGALSGYRRGVERKRALLHQEAHA
jgi:hypothetical protein